MPADARALEDEGFVVEGIGDADGEVAGEQVVDDLADDFGPPALGKERDLAVLEAAEIEAIGDQVADVLGGAGEARRDLGAAADAAQARC